MTRGTRIIAFRHRWLVPLAVVVGFGLLSLQATLIVHTLEHLHGAGGPAGRLPHTERDCVVLHSGALVEPPQDDIRPVGRVVRLPLAGREHRPEVPAVEAPIARAPPSLCPSST